MDHPGPRVLARRRVSGDRARFVVRQRVFNTLRVRLNAMPWPVKAVVLLVLLEYRNSSTLTHEFRCVGAAFR
jgi:hypothetical protein